MKKILLLLTIATFAVASTINVPADHPTIQAAIDAASPYDIIKVAAGTYPEKLYITTTDLEIIGDNRATVIIDPTGLATNNAGIYVNADNISLKSFTLRSTITNSLPRYGIKFGEIGGCTLEDVTVHDVSIEVVLMLLVRAI